ncbi:MAG: choice-of-anchor Q domain-containing protein [Gammaproteobacteria bacterium]
MTERKHRSPPSAGILAVFREELARSPAGIGRADPSLRPRFVAHYQRLARLPRKARRALQRQWRRSLAGIALWCALGQVPAALAAQIDVGVGCTLVDAITAANQDAATGGCPAGSAAEPDTITLPVGSNQALTTPIDDSTYGTYGPTGLPVVTSAIVIDGNGSTIGRVPETPEFRILAIGSSGDLTLQETTVTGGAIPAGSPNENGGGIINYGTLALTACTVSANSAYNGGGGVHSFGVSTLTHSTVSYNTAMVSGGVSNHGVLTLANSTISGNFANSRGGGVFNNVYAMMTVTNSTISGNSAYYHGGGVWNAGALSLTNGTVLGNSAGHYGYDGYVGQGGGVLNSSGTLTLVQTLVSGNSASSRGAEVYHYSGVASAAILANGFNLFGHDGDAGIGGFVPGVTDIVPAVPLTGILDPALADNGGPTQTHTLVTGSPAIDAVPAASCATTGDQSGVMRPQDGDRDTVADCDIGALEPPIPAPGPPGATPANRNPRLRCNRSVCRVLLRCDLTQDSGTPCNSAVNIFVPAEPSRLDGDRAAPKSIPFASGVAQLEPGQIANVRIRLTKRGRRIVRTTTRTTLRGRLQIENPDGTHETRIRITLRR